MLGGNLSTSYFRDLAVLCRICYSVHMMNIRPSIDLRGHGGKEPELARLFGITRVHDTLYDAVDVHGRRIEFKKGASRLAWLDLRKWLRDDLDITYRFVEYDSKTGAPTQYCDQMMSEVAECILLKNPRAFEGAKFFLDDDTQLKKPYWPSKEALWLPVPSVGLS